MSTKVHHKTSAPKEKVVPTTAPTGNLPPLPPVPAEVPSVAPVKLTPDQAKTLLTDYRVCGLTNLKNIYLKLLNDNLVYLIEYIYKNSTQEPYQSPDVRVALALQMILSSEELIPMRLSSLIAKDLEALRKDDKYTSRWVNPALKRKRLLKELEMLRKHTEIDDSISLNLADKTEADEKPNLADFDIHSGISTLNVSETCPLPDDEEDNRCLIM